ncbi:MAG TPA: hypothetical protein V6C58_14240 [Allocoleopsis sp.]
MSSIIHYKNFDVSKMSITKPESRDSGYVSKITYEGHKLCIQTPDLCFSEGTISFKMVNKGRFFTLLEEIYEKLVDLLYTNSKTFFNGKNFSEKRIRESLKKIMVLEENGIVKLNVSKDDKNMKIYNRFKDQITYPQENFVGSCIFSFESLVFDRYSITPMIVVKCIKVTNIAKKKSKKCMFVENIDTCIDTEIENLDSVPFFS